MENERIKKYSLIGVVIICCILMALVETVIEPPYLVKSGIKITLFLCLPFLCMKLLHIKAFDQSFSLKRVRALKLLLLGACIYLVIIGAYFLTGTVFDYAALVDSLSADQQVTSSQFLPVALYISFCNSFLEEFLFRFFAFIKLSEHMEKPFAYLFSSVAFAVYHIGMIGASFPIPLLLLAVFGLTVGGLIFDCVDEKSKSIYPSWIIHMFADFSIMTIWYIQMK